MADPAQFVTSITLPSVIKVAWTADVRQAAASGKNLAGSLGFPPKHCEEIHLVLTELASNLLRHASHGTITLNSIQMEERVGIQIESEDDGPGILDVELAITDGYSTSDSLGLGLGAINRLMDDLDFSSGPAGGLRIVCRRWVRPNPDRKPESIQAKELVCGVATRACRLQPDNGDAFIIKHWGRNAITGVIDGLGHGPLARRASQAARQYIEEHFDQPLENIFRGADRACRATRGVVMALARFDLLRQKVTVANVGNIEARLLSGPERFNLMVRRGVIGLNAPSPVCVEHPWTDSSMLVMHSDGLRANWSWNDFPEMAHVTPDQVARRLLNALGNLQDDATVLVARSARG